MKNDAHLDNQNLNRREFLRTATRWAVALTLGGGLMALTMDRGRECLSRGACGSCPLIGTCNLPQATPAAQAGSPK